MSPGIRKIFTTILVILGIYLAVQYLLPLSLPFLLGTGLALAAEPIVSLLCRRCKMRRGLATGIGVTATFLLITLAAVVLLGLLVRELGSLAGILPDLESTVRTGMASLSGWLLELASKAPAGMQTVLARNVTEFFSGGSALLDKVTDWFLRLASGILSHVPDSALGLGTGIISSFMISAKLPRLKEFFHSCLPLQKLRPQLEALKHLKSALGGWLKAQAKLSGITYLIAAVGFFLLRIPHAFLWALVVALVDAFPILGTGTALIPWSLVSFLQGDHIQAFGLLGIYAAAAVTRSVLEPRLVGRQLGLDPLVTLAALYAGYRLWGFGGMLLAPLLAVAAAQLLETQAGNS